MERELTITRLINAPRERLWRAWTDPKEVAAWWGPDGVSIPVCEIDLRIGGTLYIVMLAGAELGPMAGRRWPMRGIFKEIVPNGRLVFTNQAITEDERVLLEGVTTVTFEEESGKTKLTVRTSAKGLSLEAPQMLAGMEQGWTQQIEKLVRYLS